MTSIEPNPGPPSTVVAVRVLTSLQVAGLVAIVLLGAVVALPAALVLALAIALLRRGRRGAWLALMIIEALLGIAGVLGAAFAFVYAALPLASCIAVIVLLGSPSASDWASPRIARASAARG